MELVGWTTRDEVKWLQNIGRHKHGKEKPLNADENTLRLLKNYMVALKRRERWDEIDRSVIVDECVKLIKRYERKR